MKEVKTAFDITYVIRGATERQKKTVWAADRISAKLDFIKFNKYAYVISCRKSKQLNPE